MQAKRRTSPDRLHPEPFVRHVREPNSLSARFGPISLAAPESFDCWSSLALLVALSLLAILTLARPAPLVALTLLLGVAVFAAGTFVAVRERIP